ncbi:hypothetical protein B0T10DRAFT_479827 [Thelonectria olida]|uniref:Uncharacterized protein n=1 Tax=Thelonectria olida TaxID=1576542 RepID=A0A9P8W9N9_9HYPO|nr:hypothetical protein B0T10DRAFT_479827 [Thelonectria olida]
MTPSQPRQQQQQQQQQHTRHHYRGSRRNRSRHNAPPLGLSLNDTTDQSLLDEPTRRSSSVVGSGPSPPPQLLHETRPLLGGSTRERSSTVIYTPDSMATSFDGSQTTCEPPSTRSGLGTPRSASAETVRGPTRPRSVQSEVPLIPFPPWDGNLEGEYPSPRWQGGNHNGAHRQYGSGGRGARLHELSLIGMENRWILSSVIHGLLLAMQFIVTLVVFSALIWVAVWQKGDEDVEFWEWLWMFAEPSLVGILLVCSATLLAHEIKILSSVVLLYLQSAILFLTTIASAILWIRCIEEYSSAVKGVLMGCNVLMWGLAVFGFVRAAIVWKVEAEFDEERMMLFRGREARQMSYGTIGPWYESYHNGRGDAA